MEKSTMRRKDRQISQAETMEILNKGEYGLLATCGDDREPYAVPLSYVVIDGHIYFHCARDGRKVSNLKANPAAGFTVVGKTQPVYDQDFSTYYESAVAFGPVAEVTDEKVKFNALYEMAAKYCPDHVDKAEASINKSISHTAVYALKMDSLTGKAKR